jgi:hypothetical protein
MTAAQRVFTSVAIVLLPFLLTACPRKPTPAAGAGYRPSVAPAPEMCKAAVQQWADRDESVGPGIAIRLTFTVPETLQGTTLRLRVELATDAVVRVRPGWTNDIDVFTGPEKDVDRVLAARANPEYVRRLVYAGTLKSGEAVDIPLAGSGVYAVAFINRSRWEKRIKYSVEVRYLNCSE